MTAVSQHSRTISDSKDLPAALVPIVEYLDRLTKRATVEELQQLLRENIVTLDDVSKYVLSDPYTYRRNLVCQGPLYEVVVICWRSGQRSPIHNHAGSTCGLNVLKGIATETVFEHTPIGQVVAVRSHDLPLGHICASQDRDTHQVSNLQVEGRDLVTLHIYSPPLREMDMFSIDSGDDLVFVGDIAH